MICYQCNRMGRRCPRARRVALLLRRALREEPIRGPIKPMRVKCLQDELTDHERGFRVRKKLPAGETRAEKTLRKQEQARRWDARAALVLAGETEVGS